MTTYPLSEPATIYRQVAADGAHGQPDDVVARGSLADCAETLEDWPASDRATVRIEVDDIDLRYGADEIEQLLAFLRHEDEA